MLSTIHCNTTATKLTGKNLKLLWAALYADDTSPLVKQSNVVDLQEALDWSIKWAEKNGCAFHLAGDKAHTYLAYLKKGEPFPLDFDSLKLAGIPFRRENDAIILGLYRKVRPATSNDPLESHGPFRNNNNLLNI